MRHLLRLTTLVCLLLAVSGQGAEIFVTTVEQKISTTGGCSLQQAIDSANFHSNIAIASYNDIRRPSVIVTQCEAGTGDDTIIIRAGATFLLSKIVDDAGNPMGPTATPMITSIITLEAHGSVIQYNGPAFDACDFEQENPRSFRAFAVGSTGHLTIRNVYVKNFLAHGGNGSIGGGGGMGAGGAIFVHDGSLLVEIPPSRAMVRSAETGLPRSLACLAGAAEALEVMVNRTGVSPCVTAPAVVAAPAAMASAVASMVAAGAGGPGSSAAPAAAPACSVAAELVPTERSEADIRAPAACLAAMPTRTTAAAGPDWLAPSLMTAAA